jgi:GT2 family glycosyltransferase
VPRPDWLEKLLKPFSDHSVGASAGTYETKNRENILARFIGFEIEWKHSRYPKYIDAHGTYNLAVRKKVLEEVGGMCEDYPVPSGEDWDMTYKISRRHKIEFVPGAIVGHYHPEKFWPYMKNQVRRVYDRIKLYKDHPEMKKGDAYTPWYVKYQVLSSIFFVPSLVFFCPFFNFSFIIPAAVVSFLIASLFPPFLYFWKKDKEVAAFSLLAQLARNFAWGWGMTKGIIKFGI